MSVPVVKAAIKTMLYIVHLLTTYLESYIM
jgi:hypothetical protein